MTTTPGVKHLPHTWVSDGLKADAEGNFGYTCSSCGAKERFRGKTKLEEACTSRPAQPPKPPRPNVPGRNKYPEGLTPRLREVLVLVGKEKSNIEIAGLLGISEHTAKFHVNTLLGVTGTNTRVGAVVESLKRGDITLEDLS